MLLPSFSAPVLVQVSFLWLVVVGGFVWLVTILWVETGVASFELEGPIAIIRAAVLATWDDVPRKGIRKSHSYRASAKGQSLNLQMPKRPARLSLKCRGPHSPDSPAADPPSRRVPEPRSNRFTLDRLTPYRSDNS
jgi:hypothetical protein